MHLLITGYFSGNSIQFGLNILTNYGLDNVFVVKYNNEGAVIWAKSGEGVDSDIANSVAVDNYGNTYLTGSFNSPSLKFGSNTLNNGGGRDVFLVKYDSTGNVKWANSYEGAMNDFGCSVATNNSGSSFLIGRFDSPTISFGPFTLMNSSQSYDIFLIKSDSVGNVIWASSYGNLHFDWGNSIAFDEFGFGYATGFFGGPSITFGQITLTGQGGIFISKFGDYCVGDYTLNLNSPLSIYPNPATSEIRIFSPDKMTRSIEILNSNGQSILQMGNDGLSSTIKISHFPKGVYFVRSIGDKQIHVIKLVKY